MLDADRLRGPSQILWLGCSQYKEEKLTSIQSEWVMLCSSLRSCSSYWRVSPPFFSSLTLSLSPRMWETFIKVKHIVLFIFLNMHSVSSHRTCLIPLFLSFCLFVLYYEGVLIHLCELASCTFNASYLLRVVRFTTEHERGSNSKVFSMELPLKSYTV